MSWTATTTILQLRSFWARRITVESTVVAVRLRVSLRNESPLQVTQPSSTVEDLTSKNA
jgi:hypothetical protein